MRKGEDDALAAAQSLFDILVIGYLYAVGE
jgi:hypothetical protein